MNSQAPIEDIEESIELMAAETLGKDLMALMIQEFKAMPDVWQRLPEHAQNDVISRLRDVVDSAVGRAAYLIAANGQQRIAGDLEKVTIQGKKQQAVINVFPANDMESLHALYESTSEPVLIVVASSEQYKGGMDEIRGERDQREMELDEAEA